MPWRLIPPHPAPAASHMALDQTLLESAVDTTFRPTLRFYLWSPPAISMGRFQPISDIDLAACHDNGIDVVRRPTGGKSILHLDDFTYSLILPKGFSLPHSVVEAYKLICRGILSALGHLGLTAVIQSRESEDYKRVPGACFAAATQADLEFDGRKLCGSAQMRRRGAILQHGSILLEDRSEALFRLLRFENEEGRGQALRSYRSRCVSLNQTGMRFNWEEVAASFIEGFRESFGVEIGEGTLTTWEKERWPVLTKAYNSPEWLSNTASCFSPRV